MSASVDRERGGVGLRWLEPKQTHTNTQVDSQYIRNYFL